MQTSKATFACLAALFALLSATATANAGARLSTREHFDRGARASFGGSGTYAVDTNTGKVLISRSASTPRAPASVEKLITSATAFEKLGASYRFETAALGSGTLDAGTLTGNLYIKGSGDPSFGTRNLANLAESVSGRDIDSVTGRVFGDESTFDSRRGTPATGFVLSGYIGPLTALAFNSGYSGNGWQSDPPKFVAQRFRSALIKDGVDITRSAQRGRAPEAATKVASSRSDTLASIVWHMNQVSDNFYAEQLLKVLGAQIGGTGSTAEGAGVVRDFARTNGFSAKVVDGSGLSRSNAVSPKSVVRLLTVARKENWFDAYLRSMPVAGHSGTLAGRMRGTAADGRCHAKTGTLSNVSALAGFCHARNNHWIAFAILNNGVNVSAARAAQDRVAASLAARR